MTAADLLPSPGMLGGSVGIEEPFSNGLSYPLLILTIGIVPLLRTVPGGGGGEGGEGGGGGGEGKGEGEGGGRGWGREGGG